MGQYYKFVNIDKKEVCERNRGMMKLMEHSYLANEYCRDILYLLSEDWKGDRIIHVGDYAEPNDGTTTQKIIDKLQKELETKSIYTDAENFEEKTINEKIPEVRYVYNYDKKEYIDLLRQPVQWLCIDKNKIYTAKINSFALLIACGNGLGGGDYREYVNHEKIGSWAGDKLESSVLFLDKYKDYTENNLIFNETNKYVGITQWNEKTSGQIIADETGMLFDTLKNISNEYDKGIDVQKLKLPKDGITNAEYKLLAPILTVIKTRRDRGTEEKLEQKDNQDNNLELDSIDIGD